MNKFYPKQPDPYIKMDGDQELAKFGHLNALVAVLTDQAQSQIGLTAHAGGGQTLATQLNQGFNGVAIVASPGDSVILPSLVTLCACTPCGPIAPVVVVNTGASSLNVFPAVGEFINGLAVNTAVAVAPGESLSFQNVSCNTWNTYGASGTGSGSPIESIVLCDTTLTPVAGVVTIPTVVTDSTLTGAGCTLSPLSVVSHRLNGTATLDFPSTSAQTSSELTITVTGAVVGNPVSLGTPAAPNANSSFMAYVSATNTVTVRFNNYSSGSIDPASGSYSVSVFQ